MTKSLHTGLQLHKIFPQQARAAEVLELHEVAADGPGGGTSQSSMRQRAISRDHRDYRITISNGAEFLLQWGFGFGPQPYNKVKGITGWSAIRAMNDFALQIERTDNQTNQTSTEPASTKVRPAAPRSPNTVARPFKSLPAARTATTAAPTTPTAHKNIQGIMTPPGSEHGGSPEPQEWMPTRRPQPKRKATTEDHDRSHDGITANPSSRPAKDTALQNVPEILISEHH
ncbi:hypothetical protein B0T24DRAFT_665160 [Lasiosphaeria ovina]|uniref:Uncharacterized protein n=1 Tax=Lasiosphaeria ovina TaxID=92902 RepID=A0AAE0KG62_9PEZI|nr:hypothetical protein B0T24DRAFT_665160 [Lasiosphaeria ovina]